MNSSINKLNLIIADDDAGIRALFDVTVGLDERYSLLACAESATELRSSLIEADKHGDEAHVALIDRSLPDTDGIELVRELRQHYPGLIIALYTGWSDMETEAAARAAGADKVFVKAGAPTTLLDQLAGLALREAC